MKTKNPKPTDIISNDDDLIECAPDSLNSELSENYVPVLTHSLHSLKLTLANPGIALPQFAVFSFHSPYYWTLNDVYSSIPECHESIEVCRDTRQFEGESFAIAEISIVRGALRIEHVLKILV